MNIKIHFRKLKFDKHPERSTTQNWVWNNKRLMVSFEGLPDDLLAKDFLWMPSYKQLDEIHEALGWSEYYGKKGFEEYQKLKKKGNKNIDWEVKV